MGSPRRALGKFKVRTATKRAKANEVIRLVGEGRKRKDIAKELGIGVANAYRMLANAPRISSSVA